MSPIDPNLKLLPEEAAEIDRAKGLLRLPGGDVRAERGVIKQELQRTVEGIAAQRQWPSRRAKREWVAQEVKRRYRAATEPVVPPLGRYV